MKLEFDDKVKLTTILEKIRSSEDVELELVLPENSLTAANPTNKEIIKRFAVDVGKKVSFASAAAPVPQDELGFVEGQDVANLTPQSPAEAPLPVIATVTEGGKKAILPRPNLSFLSRVPRIYLAAAGLVLLLVFFFIFLWLLPSAEVTLTYDSTTKNATSELTAVIGSATNVDSKTVSATSEEVVKNDLAATDTTGKKNVGDPAKGRVTIVNRSSSPRTFIAGSVITPVATSSATFTLDSDVDIPASQCCPGDDGKAGVNVTARSIGPSGNLAAGITFTVNSLQTQIVYATNDTAFSGGSTKTVNVVAEADKKKLKDQLMDSLTKKATDEIKTQDKDSIIPEGGVEVTVSKETYDHDVGQEADQLSLSLEVTAKAVVLKLSDLIVILTKTMNVPTGFKVSEKDSSASASLLSKTTATNSQIQGKISAVLVPDIDTGKVSKNLAGKRLGAAKAYLDSLESVKSYSIKFNPGFYRAFGWLPLTESKIHVKMEKSSQ